MRAASAVMLSEMGAEALETLGVRTLSDEELMARLSQGSSAAFEELFERYRDQVFSYLARLAGRVVSEDLTQTTFLSVFHGCNRFLPGSRFRPWLYAIATNAFRDYRRRHKLEQENQVTTLRGLTDEGAMPSYHDAGLERAVWLALQQLPETQRFAVAMHRFQELSFSEIGDVLKLKEQVVRARAHRGYEQLRQLLRGVWEER